MNDALEPYGIQVDGELCSKILVYMSLLGVWNKRISLTTITDPVDVLKYHFGESFFATPAVPIIDGRLADVGTGAGFPGIPIKMICPKLRVTLIESNRKKCAFLSEVIRKLDLNEVEVIKDRMENFAAPERKFDFVTARAIGQPRELFKFSNRCLSPSGKIVLWLGENDASIVGSMFTDWRWSLPKKIPCSDRRYLLTGSVYRNERST